MGSRCTGHLLRAKGTPCSMGDLTREASRSGRMSQGMGNPGSKAISRTMPRKIQASFRASVSVFQERVSEAQT